MEREDADTDNEWYTIKDVGSEHEINGRVALKHWASKACCAVLYINYQECVWILLLFLFENK